MECQIDGEKKKVNFFPRSEMFISLCAASQIGLNSREISELPFLSAVL
jgi:hypothetical protein